MEGHGQRYYLATDGAGHEQLFSARGDSDGKGALSKRDAERQARELRKAGKAARVARKGQSGWQVIIDGERSQ